MHPRAARVALARRREPSARGAAGVRPRARRGASARGRSPLLARHGDELLGRFVERHHASARGDALPRHAARGAARSAASAIYAPHEHGAAPTDAAARRAQLDALVDVVVRKYAPLPAASLSYLVSRLRYAVPQWHGELSAALQRAQGSASSHARVDGHRLVLAGRRAAAAARRDGASPDTVRLLAPFDPVVWDRRRFELLWGWAYRFEAYTPAAEAQARLLRAAAALARPRDRLGQSRRSRTGSSQSDFGYVAAQPPRDRAFARELEAELERMRAFLGLDAPAAD